MNWFLRRVIALSSLLLIATSAFAGIGEGSGNIVGQLENLSVGEYSVNATDPSTGRSRDVSVAADGTFRFSQLPVGQYELTVSRDGTVVARDTFMVALNSNTSAVFALQDAGAIEEITVTGSKPAYDTYSTDSGVVLDEAQIDFMPVPRNLTSVALLAPGTVKGDSNWDSNGSGATAGYASFGGSSVAENSCYINGLEVTNTRQGLGCGELPFEFYEQFQIKTGGYSAQYGRTTGGVINATSKSGTNDWEFGAGVAVEPGAMFEKGRISRGGGGLGAGVGGAGTGRVFRNTSKNEVDIMEYWLTAGGPIIQDRLFVYAIANPREESQDFQSETSGRNQYAAPDEFTRREFKAADNIFWGAKIDWDINDYHRLSAWGYDAQREGFDKTYNFDAGTGTIGAQTETFTRIRGSKAESISYKGTFMDSLTVSAMWGKVEAEYTSNPSGDPTICPQISDERSPTPSTPITGCGPGGVYGTNADENTQVRLDVEWAVGDHVLRAGYDQQDRDSVNSQADIGGGRWTYSTLAPNGVVQGNFGPIYTNNTGLPVEYVQVRVFSNEEFGGKFSSELAAYYVEDEWSITDDIVVYLGARQDSLTNYGTTGIAFADFDQPWAPRLGTSWDLGGSGSDKMWATWGRYYLPMANNTNFRVGSGVSDTTTYYTYTGVNSGDGTPTGLLPLGGALDNNNPVVNSAAEPPTQDQFQAKEADPFYKDEFIIGYERFLENGDSFTVAYINREVGATLDDYCGFYSNPGYCTMVNPGFGGSWSSEAGGELTYYDAETIGLPKGENTYNALNLEYNHAGDDINWTLIYTWSQSIGNFEGAVKSDITQADAGITQDFDFPALMDGAYGYLPNDRRHVLKFHGSYQFTDNLTFGWQSTLQSGRPLSVYGAGYPDTGANVFGSYGDTYYLFTNTCNLAGGGVGACPNDAAQEDKIYRFTGRGKAGRTPWLVTFDASITYGFEFSGLDMTARVQVFNLFDFQEPVHFNEHAEARRSEGTPNEWFGAAYAWQVPRHVRLELQARF